MESQSASSGTCQVKTMKDGLFESGSKKKKSKQKRMNYTSKVERTEVLILGAGMAGISAAHTLWEAGMTDFIVLEASERIGGRVCETSFGGVTIELGANWIHGVENNNNPLQKFAEACNLKVFPTNYYALTGRDSYGRENSKTVLAAMHKAEEAEEQASEFVHDLGFGDVDEELFLGESELGPTVADSEKEAEDTGPDSGTVPLPDITLRDAMQVAAKWRVRTASQIAGEYFHIDYMTGAPPEEVSTLGDYYHEHEDVFGVQDSFVIDQRGYSTIIRHLASNFENQPDPEKSGLSPRIRFNEKVAHVDYSMGSEKEGSKWKEPSRPRDLPEEGVYVRTQSGHKYWARYAIITFPNNVLLSGQVEFSPKLPEWKKKALRISTTNVYDKIFLKFASDAPRFWDPSEYIVYIDNEPLESTNDRRKNRDSSSSSKSPPRKGRNSSWQPFSGQKGKCTLHVPGADDDESGKESIASSPENPARRSSSAVCRAQRRGDKFTRGYYTVWQNLSIEGVFPDVNMLMVTLTDQMAIEAENKSDAQLALEMTSVLRRMYGERVPEPEEVYCTRWHSNPLALGSFHNLSPGCTPAAADNLSANVGDLHFAGDGTTARFTGMLHGAYLTGKTQAMSILEKLETSPKPQ